MMPSYSYLRYKFLGLPANSDVNYSNCETVLRKLGITGYSFSNDKVSFALSVSNGKDSDVRFKTKREKVKLDFFIRLFTIPFYSQKTEK
jgi:hypothetical protein